jgi:hypothetical protein
MGVDVLRSGPLRTRARLRAVIRPLTLRCSPLGACPSKGAPWRGPAVPTVLASSRCRQQLPERYRPLRPRTSPGRGGRYCAYVRAAAAFPVQAAGYGERVRPQLPRGCGQSERPCPAFEAVAHWPCPMDMPAPWCGRDEDLPPLRGAPELSARASAVTRCRRICGTPRAVWRGSARRRRSSKRRPRPRRRRKPRTTTTATVHLEAGPLGHELPGDVRSLGSVGDHSRWPPRARLCGGTLDPCEDANQEGGEAPGGRSARAQARPRAQGIAASTDRMHRQVQRAKRSGARWRARCCGPARKAPRRQPAP